LEEEHPIERITPTATNNNHRRWAR